MTPAIAYSEACPRCGRILFLNSQGNWPFHFGDPHAKRWCDNSTREAQFATAAVPSSWRSQDPMFSGGASMGTTIPEVRPGTGR